MSDRRPLQIEVKKEDCEDDDRMGEDGREESRKVTSTGTEAERGDDVHTVVTS